MPKLLLLQSLHRKGQKISFGKWCGASKKEDQQESVVKSCPFSRGFPEIGQAITNFLLVFML